MILWCVCMCVITYQESESRTKNTPGREGDHCTETTPEPVKDPVAAIVTHGFADNVLYIWTRPKLSPT